MLCLQYFFTPSTGLPPPPLSPAQKWYIIQFIIQYLDKHICKQMSIISFLTDVSFLQNYIVPNNLFFGGCMAASTLCILSVVS